MEIIFYLFAYIFTSKVYNFLKSVSGSILYFLLSSIFIFFNFLFTIFNCIPFTLQPLILMLYLVLESSKYFNSNSQLFSVYKDSKEIINFPDFLSGTNNLYCIPLNCASVIISLSESSFVYPVSLLESCV